jgi:multidrug efflux system membrane fusion protein
MRTIFLRTGVLSALLVLLACGRTEPAPEPARPVLTQVLEAGVDAGAVSYSGEVRSRYEIPLGFRIGGKIAARLVDNGALVKAGDVLARLDPVDTALSAAAAQAQLELAEADVRRYRELRGKNFVSQAALDAKETTYKSTKAQADLARNQSAYTELRADKAGVIELVSAEVGQVVAAGQTVMRVARTDSLEVAVSIPEARMPEVRLRKAAEITLWADDKARYPGVVRELSSTADALTRTYPARVSFINADAKILLGMTASVRLLRDGAEQQADARVAVPLSAIFQQDGAPALWVVAADQTIALRPVKVASYGDTRAILADGVKAGERIVIAGVHKLTAGEKIKAVDQSPAVTQ